MMDIYIGATNKTYDLEVVKQRFVLREDLAKEGFFLVDGYQRFWETFEKPVLKKEELHDLMNSIKLFQVQKHGGESRN